ncbi:MAG: hypothetical protein KY455_13810 [Euryarchaeota archaeon]|nr:hypothetical protein [Euryarchaeota archaeon]
MDRLSPSMHALLVVLGIAVALAGMVYLFAGVQHGGPTTDAHRMDTRIGAVLLSVGILLQAWPAVALTASSWKAKGSGGRRGIVVKACILFVGMAIAVAGLSYIADGTQAGGRGGMGIDPTTGEPDPSLAGGDGQADSPGNVWIGSALTLVGLALQLAPVFMGGRHAEPVEGIVGHDRPQGLRGPRDA